MSSKVKKLVYWLSVVAPVWDILYGAVTGIIDAWDIARTQRQYNELVKRETEMFYHFREDNKND